MKTITIEEVENGYIVTTTERRVFTVAADVVQHLSNFLVPVESASEIQACPPALTKQKREKFVKKTAGPPAAPGAAEIRKPAVRSRPVPPLPAVDEGFIAYAGNGCPTTGNAIVCICMLGEAVGEARLYRAEEANWDSAVSYKVIRQGD